MNTSMQDLLIRVVVDLCIFLELSDDATVDSRSAARQLEQVSQLVSTLPVEDRSYLVSHIRLLATTESHPDRKACTLNMAQALAEL